MPLAAAALVWSSACTVGPSYTPPAIAVPDGWSDDSREAPAMARQSLEKWWTEFHDPVLDALITRAIDGNLDLDIAEARVREARALRGIADAAAQPELDAGGTFGRRQRSDALPALGPRTHNLFEAGWDASWEIDLFGGVRRDREAARAQVQSVEEAHHETLVTLLADVARTYLELRAAQRELRVVDDALRSRQLTLDLVRARARAGLDRDLDVARAEERLASAKGERPLLERAAGLALHRLAVLLGEHPDALSEKLHVAAPFPPAPPAIPDVLPSELLSRRPDLRRAERELAAATARTGVARAELYPRFVILGNFGRLSADIDDLGSGRAQFGGLIAGARWPVLSGGRIRANIRVHDARQEQAALAYEQAVLRALQDVADSLLSEARERERQEALREAVSASRRAYEIAAERYRGGLDDYLSVLDAERTLYAAEQALVRSERDLSIAVIALYKSVGGGWSPTEETRS